MHDWVLDTWYGASTRGRWLAPLSWLFGAAAGLRRQAYARGWLPRYRASRPVVVVGNLTVGGTGKTPFTAWLARQLGARGFCVGVALRGYRGAASEARRLGPGESSASAGDEAVLLARRGLPVAVAARRADAVRLLEPDCELILCDDGLQHYALARDFEIAVVDGGRGLGNGRLLPAGPLREPAARLDEVDAVVVNGAGYARNEALGMDLEPVAVVSLDGRERRGLGDFAGREVIAAAAIGNPGRFFAMLRGQGLQPEEFAFPDHAAITPSMLPERRGRPVLMTEKDAVKCGADGWQDAWYVEVRARVQEPGATRLVQRIAEFAAARPQGNAARD
ncbi:MAG TPA: tetraacyldisaccharide 4'-kinase [Steroidobacteraceae bacterium]|nr:tetraacyldisaccharide 4'-kinase [Steroidobacteraceae bacterium]